MNWNFDAIDLQTLRIVQPDARRSLAQIVRAVKRSQATCFKRPQRMKEGGVIRRTVTLLNPNAINVPATAIVTIKLGSLEKPLIELIAARLVDVPEIMDVFLVAVWRELLLRVVMPCTTGWPALQHKLKAYVPAGEMSASFVQCLQTKTALPLGFADIGREFAS
jgi:Lrp/AsnC family transcriptional regulator